MITIETAKKVIATTDRLIALRDKLTEVAKARHIRGKLELDYEGRDGRGYSSSQNTAIWMDAKQAFGFIRAHYEREIAACIRELNSLGAQIPPEKTK